MYDTPQQLDFGNLLFDQKRKSLYVSEVAEGLEMTEQHVRDLIEEGKLGAVNIGNGSRKFWRIPVAEYEKFLKQRQNMNATK